MTERRFDAAARRTRHSITALQLRCLQAGAAFAALLAFLAAAFPSHGQSLRGTRAALDRQNRQAHRHDFTYLQSPDQVYRFVTLGHLVPVEGNGDYEVKQGTSFPYARPEVKLFLERLGRQYKAACREELVVTSLTRPTTRQPRNASPRSVHPTGMALDLRRSWSRRCRGWLESVLLALEHRGVLEANRERSPPHYHVALFPRPYAEYVAQIQARGIDEAEEATSRVARYVVRRGDTLWRIAHRHDTSVDRIRAANAIPANTIRPGQVLDIPAD
ncbi:MAG: DUF5715 family protein [Thermoanaerobaculia bacterium]